MHGTLDIAGSNSCHNTPPTKIQHGECNRDLGNANNFFLLSLLTVAKLLADSTTTTSRHSRPYAQSLSQNVPCPAGLR